MIVFLACAKLCTPFKTKFNKKLYKASVATNKPVVIIIILFGFLNSLLYFSERDLLFVKISNNSNTQINRNEIENIQLEEYKRELNLKNDDPQINIFNLILSETKDAKESSEDSKVAAGPIVHVSNEEANFLKKEKLSLLFFLNISRLRILVQTFLLFLTIWLFFSMLKLFGLQKVINNWNFLEECTSKKKEIIQIFKANNKKYKKENTKDQESSNNLLKNKLNQHLEKSNLMKNQLTKNKLLDIFSYSNIMLEFENPSFIPGLREQKLRNDFLFYEYLTLCLSDILRKVSKIDLFFLFMLKLFFTIEILFFSKNIICRSIAVVLSIIFFLFNYIKIVKISRLPLATSSNLENQMRLSLKLPEEEISRQIKPLPRIFQNLSKKISKIPGKSNLQRQYFMFGLSSLPIKISKYLELLIITDCFFHCFDLIFSHKNFLETIDLANHTITLLEIFLIFVHLILVNQILIRRQVIGSSLLYFKNYKNLQATLKKKSKHFESYFVKLKNRFKWLYRYLQLGRLLCIFLFPILLVIFKKLARILN